MASHPTFDATLPTWDADPPTFDSIEIADIRIPRKRQGGKSRIPGRRLKPPPRARVFLP